MIVHEFDFKVEHRPGRDMGLPNALSRRHYAPIFDEVLWEAQELGIVVATQEEKRKAKEEYMLVENSSVNLSKICPYIVWNSSGISQVGKWPC